MRSFVRNILMLSCVLSLFCGTLRAESISVSLEGDRLSVDVKDAPIKKILETLASECGASVFMDKSLEDKRVSVVFKNQPLEKAVKRLVSPYNSALVFSKRQSASGRSELYVSEIKVFESSKAKGDFIRIGKPAEPEKEKPKPKPRKLSKPMLPKPEDIADPLVREMYKAVSEMAEKEKEIKEEMDRLSASLSDTEDETEKEDIRSKLSDKKEELEKLREDSKKELREFDRKARARQKAEEQ